MDYRKSKKDTDEYQRLRDIATKMDIGTPEHISLFRDLCLNCEDIYNDPDYVPKFIPDGLVPGITGMEIMDIVTAKSTFVLLDKLQRLEDTAEESAIKAIVNRNRYDTKSQKPSSDPLMDMMNSPIGKMAKSVAEDIAKSGLSGKNADFGTIMKKVSEKVGSMGGGGGDGVPDISSLLGNIDMEKTLSGLMGDNSPLSSIVGMMGAMSEPPTKPKRHSYRRKTKVPPQGLIDGGENK